MAVVLHERNLQFNVNNHLVKLFVVLIIVSSIVCWSFFCFFFNFSAILLTLHDQEKQRSNFFLGLLERK